MVTVANPYLSDGHRSWENGVCEDAVNTPAHVLSCLLVEFLETQIGQSKTEVRLLLTEVTIKVPTDDGRFFWIQTFSKMIIEGFVVLASIDVDDIHPSIRDLGDLKVTLIHISQIGII